MYLKHSFFFSKNIFFSLSLSNDETLRISVGFHLTRFYLTRIVLFFLFFFIVLVTVAVLMTVLMIMTVMVMMRTSSCVGQHQLFAIVLVSLQASPHLPRPRIRLVAAIESARFVQLEQLLKLVALRSLLKVKRRHAVLVEHVLGEAALVEKLGHFLVQPVRVVQWRSIALETNQ